MNLNIDNWNKEKIKKFNNYLFSIRKEDKIEWTKSIINTNFSILAINSKTINEIVKEILKGNYISFLDNIDFKYHEVTIIYDKVLSKIKDINKFIYYVEKISLIIDNWATVDSIDFKIAKKNKEFFFNKVNEYINSNHTFVKRIGIRILFQFLNDDDIKEVIELINKINIDDYYVSMVIAWLLCEATIKCDNFVNKYFNLVKIDNDTKKRYIRKCLDSFRISDDDKNIIRRL